MMRNGEKTPCSVSVFPVNAKRITYLENFGEKRKTKNKLHPGDWGHQRWAMRPWCQACYLPCNLTGMVKNGVLFRLPDHRQALLSPRDRTERFSSISQDLVVGEISSILAPLSGFLCYPITLSALAGSFEGIVRPALPHRLMA